MRRKLSVVLMAGAAMLLFGCGSKKETSTAEMLEKGQVVATVDGEDVTIYEVNGELRGANFANADQRKTAEKAALQQIVNRKILAKIARERGLDKSPNYLLQERRANDLLLVNLLRSSIASKLGTPTRAEAGQYMDQHPNMFAERKIYALDQIRFSPPETVAKLSELQPMKTMAEVEQWLVSNNLEYQRMPASIDASKTDPNLVAKIAALPAGEIFVVPTGNMIVANQITQVRTEPFTGEKAMTYAMQVVQSQKLADAAKKDLDKVLEDRRAAVKYQEGFSPPKPDATAKNGAKPAAPVPAQK